MFVWIVMALVDTGVSCLGEAVQDVKAYADEQAR